MRRRDVQNEMADDFQPTPGLKIGPEGVQGMPEQRSLPVDPPRLCLEGPCRHYHRMVIQLDAQQPGDSRDTDGTLRSNGRVFHPETHHYCYPDVGIESNLGAHPVLECNRWVPLSRLSRIPIVGPVLARIEAQDIKRRYDVRLSQFHAEREAEAAAYVPPEFIDLVVTVHLPRVRDDDPRAHGTRYTFRPLTTLRQVLEHDLASPMRTRRPDAEAVLVCIVNGELIDNLDATIGELGLVDMTDIVFDYTANKETP